GIAPDVIRHIFQDFYTTGKSGSYGLGLPFCKKVMRSFGGNIKCISQPGEWSQFTLTFPPITSDTVTEIKDELTKMKSILLVSNQDIIVQKMVDISRFMGFDVTVLDVKSVFKKKEYEFEFDLIFVDVESLDVLENQLDRIESLLSFTEARVVYLFEHKPAQRAKKVGQDPIW
ncbi:MULTISPECIES: sensor histidine kinase, partial [Vibrio]|uniref:sensor histidine kinase n=1 Tax=Vibrio TaxID=662 RepID=UPI001CDD8E1D